MLTTLLQCLFVSTLVNHALAYTIPNDFYITRSGDVKRDSESKVVYNQSDPVLMCQSTFGDSAEENAKLWYGTSADYELDTFISRNNPDDPNREKKFEAGTGKGWFEKNKQTVFNADGEMPNCAQAGSGTCHVSSQVCCKYKTSLRLRMFSLTLSDNLLREFKRK
jgi:hypothetical protein